MFDIENLDIVITRNCQLSCNGCLVFSDHKEVKEHLNPKDWDAQLSFWGSKLRPKNLILFGGEPLMNPFLKEWVYCVRKYFPDSYINIQTNGILVEKIAKSDLKSFIENARLTFTISKHSNDKFYLEKINNAINYLKLCTDFREEQIITDGEIFYRGNKGSFQVVDWTTRPWVSHYNGWGKNISPSRDWDSDYYVKHHEWCEAKTYIQFYHGKLWKCPTIAVLKESLSQINNNKMEIWNPWFNYFALESGADDDTIESWLEQQKNPERICNMCFGNPRPTEEHFIKIGEIKNV